MVQQPRVAYDDGSGENFIPPPSFGAGIKLGAGIKTSRSFMPAPIEFPLPIVLPVQTSSYCLHPLVSIDVHRSVILSPAFVWMSPVLQGFEGFLLAALR